MVIDTSWKGLRRRIERHVTVYDILKKEKMMHVKMKRDLPAAFDGNTVQWLKAGETYDIPESFALRYIGKGIAEQERIKDPAPENKALDAAPENKAKLRRKRRKR